MTTDAKDAQYAEAVTALYVGGYRERMVAVLTRTRDALATAGYTVSGPHDLSGDEYRWYISVEGNGLSEPVDVSMEIAESAAYEGTTDGVNFGLGIVAEGGSVLGGLTPFNFTDEVWVAVDDPDALDARFRVIEDADPSGVVTLIDSAREALTPHVGSASEGSTK